MPTRNKPKPISETSDRTEPITVGPEQTQGLIAAWDGIFHFLGGRVEKWVPTEDGLVAENLTVDANLAETLGYSVEQLLTDINLTGHRTSLYPALNYIFGFDPAPFVEGDDKAMTMWLVTNFKNSVEPNSSKAPKYARDAVKAYKAAGGFLKARGPKPKSFYKSIPTLTAEGLEDSETSDLERLIAISQAALAAKAAKIAASI